MKKLLITSIVFLILVIISFLILSPKGSKEYYLEGFVIDNQTKEPVPNVNITLSQVETKDFPLIMFYWDWSKFHDYSVLTNKEGYFRKNLNIDESVTIQIFLHNKNSTYEFVENHYKENSNVTIYLNYKKTPEEYIDDPSRSLFDCSFNGYYWSEYYKQCYLDYSNVQDIPEVDKSCTVDSDCKKICPYGCFNKNQEYDGGLYWPPPLSQCEEMFCVCIGEGTCAEGLG